MSDKKQTIRAGLKRYWRQRRIKNAVHDLRQTKAADDTAIEERRWWSGIVEGDNAIFDSVELLSEPSARGIPHRCAIAILRAYLISGGDSQFVLKSIKAQIRHEAETLEGVRRRDFDAYEQLVLQARARLSKRNRPFYTGVYFAFGGSTNVGSAETFEQMVDDRTKHIAWSSEAIMMIAALHAYSANVEANTFARNAVSDRAYKLPSAMVWRPNISEVTGTSKIRRKKSLENDLRRLGALDAFCLLYGLFSVENADGRNLAAVLLDPECEALDLTPHLQAAMKRARFVFERILPKPLRAKQSPRWGDFIVEPFAHMPKVWADDAGTITKVLEARKTAGGAS